MEHILQRAAQVRLLICDVDGVFSDGTIYLSDQGHEYKQFHVHDGLGIKLLLKTGVHVAVISSRSSPLVEKRMRALGIQHIYQGHAEKLPAYIDLLRHFELTDTQAAYVGDDYPDLPLLKRVGLSIAVANAVSLVKQYTHWQTKTRGGQGAIREICELIMLAQNTLNTIQTNYLTI
jgi:3-deoxy-D-manno-octulosonate 8-phosphate phosphatase (KDO 8-P phosphatase)